MLNIDGFLNGFLVKCAEDGCNPADLLKIAAAPHIPQKLLNQLIPIMEQIRTDPRAGRGMFNTLVKDNPELLEALMGWGKSTGSRGFSRTMDAAYDQALDAFRAGRRYTPFDGSIVPSVRPNPSRMDIHGLTADDLSAMSRAGNSASPELLPTTLDGGALARGGAGDVAVSGYGVPARLSDVEGELTYGPRVPTALPGTGGIALPRSYDDIIQISKNTGKSPEEVVSELKRLGYGFDDPSINIRHGISPEEADIIDAAGIGAGRATGAAEDAAAAGRAAGDTEGSTLPGGGNTYMNTVEAPAAPKRSRFGTAAKVVGGTAAGIGLGAAIVGGGNNDSASAQGTVGQNRIDASQTAGAGGAGPANGANAAPGIGIDKARDRFNRAMGIHPEENKTQPDAASAAGQTGFQPSTETPLTPLQDRRLAGGVGMGYLSDVGITPDQVEAMARYYNQNRNGKFRANYPTFGDFYNKANSLPAAQRNEGFRRMGMNTGIYVEGPDGELRAWQSGTPTNSYTNPNAATSTTSKAAEAGYADGFRAKIAQVLGNKPNGQNGYGLDNLYEQYLANLSTKPGWLNVYDSIIPSRAKEHLDTSRIAHVRPGGKLKNQALERETFRRSTLHNLALERAPFDAQHNALMSQHAQEAQRTANREKQYQANLQQSRQHDAEFAAKQKEWDAQREAHRQRMAALRSRAGTPRGRVATAKPPVVANTATPAS